MEGSKIKETGELKRGIPMSEEDIADYQKVWSDMEENINEVMENGEDLSTTHT